MSNKSRQMFFLIMLVYIGEGTTVEDLVIPFSDSKLKMIRNIEIQQKEHIINI